MGLDIHAAALGGWVREFVRVNNRMAGILREPTPAELGAHRGLLAANSLCVENLEVFVQHVAPGAGWRMRSSEDDGRGGEAGPRQDLETIVRAAKENRASATEIHRLYRLLRPFTDANGRCGRVLWMWQMMRSPPGTLAEVACLDLSDSSHPLNRDAMARSSMM
jgi:hypothetical protein